MTIAAASYEMSERRARARRGLAIYFAAVVAGSAIFEGLLLATKEPIDRHQLLVLALMWTPAFASIVARVAMREGVCDVSLRFGGRRGARELLLAWIYPIAVGGIAYGTAWTTGLCAFEAPRGTRLAALGLPPALQFLVSLALSGTLGALFGVVATLGEELGWRGFMLTRLIDAGAPRPVLVSGVAWGLWHVPLIISGQYASGPHAWLSAALFLPSIVAGAYVAARLRLVSGSVWPAVLFHSSWNALIQGSFDRFTKGGSATHSQTIWVGESGILVVAAAWLVTLWLLRRPLGEDRRPGL